MTVMLLTEQHLQFLRLKGGCTCLSESTLVKMPHCLKSHVMAQRQNALASPLDTVRSHRTPDDGAHFEHVQNERSGLAL